MLSDSMTKLRYSRAQGHVTLSIKHYSNADRPTERETNINRKVTPEERVEVESTVMLHI